ncbi:MAG: DUF1289 domain-containing protein [Planctomycetaceae bacterium]|nr:DUF1289 domain-containing protein [Planctomycetaceae bacterium]
MDAVISPCDGVCRIDPGSDQCLSCRRSLNEIAAWPFLSPAERNQVMSDLHSRTSWPLESLSLESSVRETCP